jgi:uncharacterized phiE125 gp8 family phage protein
MRLPASQLTVVTPPPEEPISVAEAKAHSRIDTDAEDSWILDAIASARQDIEDQVWRTLVTTIYDGYLECWPYDGFIELPRPPLQSVGSVKYTDTDGNQNTFSGASYLVQTIGDYGRIVLKHGETWPSASLEYGFPIVIRFTAGYGAAIAVPERIKQMCKLAFGAQYEHRESLVLGQGVSLLEVPTLRAMAYQLRAW